MTQVVIDYTNWRGKRSLRRIILGRLVRGSNAYHPETQWLLEAHDVERGEHRIFAMKDIHSWTPSDGGSTSTSPSAEESSQQVSFTRGPM